jgi:predicted nucleic acid-binding protein
MNVVDSSGWIEYFAGAPNAPLFPPAILDCVGLLVPTIVLYEVCKWMTRECGPEPAGRAVNAMRQGRIVSLDAELALLAARLSRQYRLPTADSLVYATAHFHGATLWTQDDDFEGISGVRYFPKTKG